MQGLLCQHLAVPALTFRPNWFVSSAFDSFFQGEINDKKNITSRRFQSNSDYIDLIDCYSRSDAGHNWHRSAARARCGSTCWVLGWHSWKPTTPLEGGLALAFVFRNVLVNKKHKEKRGFGYHKVLLSFFSGCCAAIYTGLAAKNSWRRHNYNKKRQGDRWAEQSVQGRKTESSHDQSGLLSTF